MKWRTRLVEVAIIAVAGCARSAVPATGVEQEIEVLAAAEFAKDQVGSLAIATLTGSRDLWTKSYGLADEADKRSATPETVYRIGSITKQFTALMLLQLVERGTVHLSDPVEKYVPEFNAIQGRFTSAPPVTLVQLATHTGGIAAEPDEPDSYSVGAVNGWERVLLEALPHTKYVYEPGSQYSYSNIGYASLGLALARAAGQSYTAYVQEHIFRPLGMTHTAFELDDAMRRHLAVGYSISDAGTHDALVSQREHAGRGYRVPNGAVYTTVGDLAAFVAFELGKGPESVLKHETLSANFERLLVANAKLTGGYGIGFEAFRRGELLGFGHSGLVAGYEAAAYFERGSGAAVIMLRSATGGAFRGTRLCVGILQKLVQRHGALEGQHP